MPKPDSHQTLRNLQKQLSSERLLHDAIAGLLARMPSIKNVRVLHGPLELGKDIVFQTPGPLGEDLNCACVIKNNKITGTVDNNAGVRSIFHQVSQSLDTPFLDPQGNEIVVDRVYVVTPFPVSQSAITSIRGGLKAAAARVVMVDGHKLFELFCNYWPDFLADEAVAIESYLRRSAEDLQNVSELDKAMLLYDLNVPKTERHSYVDLDLTVHFHAYRFESHFNALAVNPREFSETNSPDSSGQFSDEAGDRTALRSEDVQTRMEILWRDAQYANSWGYWDETHAPLGPSVRGPLAEIVTALRSHENKPAMLPESHLDEARLAAIATLKWLDKGLSLLRNEVHNREVFLKELRKSGALPHDMLSDERFYQAFKLEEFFQSSPWGNLRPSSIFSILFPSREMLDSFKSFLIVGPAGSGKTTFCRWNALQDTRDYLARRSDTIPIYVPLHLHQIITAKTIDGLLLSGSMGRAALGESDFKDFIKREKRIRIYLDGLDEVFSSRTRQAILELVQHEIGANPNLQAVVSSRDYAIKLSSVKLPRLRLAELTADQVRKIAACWIDADEAEAFFAEFTQIFTGTDSTLTPLLVTITAAIYKKLKHLPRSKTRLYEIFTDLLCGGWDMAKGVMREHRFPREQKLGFLSHLAYTLQKKGMRLFERNDASNSIVWFHFDDLRSNIDALLAELIDESLLTRSADSFQFRHLSFQEYFAARYCLRQPSEEAIRGAIMNFVKGDERWHEVISFYLGMCDPSRDLHGWINMIEAGDRRQALNEMLFRASGGT